MSYKYSKLVNAPSSEGIDPTKLVLSSTLLRRFKNLVKLIIYRVSRRVIRPISEGMVPTIPGLCLMLSPTRPESIDILEGIVP